MPKYLRVRNFERFQHYKQRSPPWIKVYSSMLDDYEFQKLSDSTKFHCVGLMLLASRLENILPNDAVWLSHKIGATEEINIKLLVEIEFLEFAEVEKRPKPLEDDSSSDSQNPKSANEPKSQFTLAECLKYAETCEGIKSPRGLATSIFKSGESDYLILKTLYPERLAAEDEKQYGPKREFTDEPCTVCFGAMLAESEGKGYKSCQHCKNEKGKPTGKEPLTVSSQQLTINNQQLTINN